MTESVQKVSVVSATDTKFESGGLRDYLQYRDLGIREATGGQYHAHIIRANGNCQEGGTGRHAHRLDFQMNYVLKGWVKMWIEGAGEVRIEQGGCWLQPPGVPHSLEGFSEDAEWMEITAPAEFTTEEV